MCCEQCGDLGWFRVEESLFKVISLGRSDRHCQVRTGGVLLERMVVYDCVWIDSFRKSVDGDDFFDQCDLGWFRFKKFS